MALFRAQQAPLMDSTQTANLTGRLQVDVNTETRRIRKGRAHAVVNGRK